MNIQAKGTPGKEEYPVDFFQRTVVEKRVFTPSFYLFPIPQSCLLYTSLRSIMMKVRMKWLPVVKL